MFNPVASRVELEKVLLQPNTTPAADPSNATPGIGNNNSSVSPAKAAATVSAEDQKIAKLEGSVAKAEQNLALAQEALKTKQGQYFGFARSGSVSVLQNDVNEAETLLAAAKDGLTRAKDEKTAVLKKQAEEIKKAEETKKAEEAKKAEEGSTLKKIAMFPVDLGKVVISFVWNTIKLVADLVTFGPLRRWAFPAQAAKAEVTVPATATTAAPAATTAAPAATTANK